MLLRIDKKEYEEIREQSQENYGFEIIYNYIEDYVCDILANPFGGYTKTLLDSNYIYALTLKEGDKRTKMYRLGIKDRELL